MRNKAFRLVAVLHTQRALHPIDINCIGYYYVEYKSGGGTVKIKAQHNFDDRDYVYILR